MYTVVKVLNNNVIFATDKHRQEVVLMGKGVGFGKRSGDTIPLGQVDKVYRLAETGTSERYRELLNQTDERIVGVCEEIIQYASQRLGEPLHPHIHIALADHIAFAIERTRKGQTIENSILAEIQSLYPVEYAIAEHALAMIDEQLGIRLPKAEEGFIAMHIHSARSHISVGNVMRSVELIADLVKLIERELDIRLDPAGLDYARLVTHLRFTLERAGTGQFHENGLVPLLKRDFAACYSIAEKVAARIQSVLGVAIPESEIGYMTIHLTRLATKTT